MKEINLKGLKETIYYEKVLKQMPVYIWKNDKVKGMFCALGVHYGSIHQEFKLDGESKYTKVPSGIAHFLEHLNFYEPDGSTATDFYTQYGSEVNAFTTFDYTCYHVYSTGQIDANLNHLLDFVLTPAFTKKMVNKERSIILEEMAMDEDIPDSKLYFKHFADLFHEYRYKETIVGTKEDVQNTNIEDIELVYNTFYHPKNMFLVVTGNVNPYEIVKIVEENLSRKELPSFKKPKLKKLKEPVSVVEESSEFSGNVENTKVKISVKTPISAFKGVDPIELRYIYYLLLHSNFGPTSDLKEYLMENELINYMSASRSFIEDYIIATITMETKYPKEAIKIVKEQLQHLEMTEENLRRKRNASVATLVLNYDDIMGVNNLIQEDILAFGTVQDNVKEHIENITLEKVEQVLKKLDTKNMSVTILNSKKEEK